MYSFHIKTTLWANPPPGYYSIASISARTNKNALIQFLQTLNISPYQTQKTLKLDLPESTQMSYIGKD